MRTNLINSIARLDSHYRLLIGLAMSAISYFVVPGNFTLPAHFTLAWVSFAMTILVLMWISISVAHPRDLPKLSQLEDSSRTLILAFVVVAAIASLYAVIVLLDSADKNSPEWPRNRLLAISAIASAWFLVHSVFTLRYAHVYYGNDKKQKNKPGGLDFPDDSEPDYLDFAYFSFVIGMTSQVSDVSISSKSMRRTALAHGLLSFGFNAIIIALTVGGLA
ncbi:DUF1345 domain-containing protein [Spirosoma radiotolerans]|uniref:DUF1345 domain-containing protein n=1 Tax=Spirosoma radiotolerans TaxID=1379870 RepID=A0A0E3ZZQ8_9BACT|nr:DUF1345 domain-containing protein [Spirosoma radiotolerans]AKD57508.1 hypothetical protein SD10_24045 [Spirosoma radiotolerans]